MRTKFIFLRILCLFILTACQSLPDNFDKSKLGTIERDITYCVMDNEALKMDILYPTTEQQKWPVVIHIHGGGWVSGTKEFYSIADAELLSKFGIMSVAVEYRLAPEYKFPAMIEDVKCAVRYLRSHAAEYNIDPSRFGAIGGSAGGHLAALLGLTDETAGFDVGEYLAYPSNIQAVVDMFGSSNVEPPYTMNLFFDPMEVFGTSDENDPIFINSSPTHYVSSDSPPFLLIHGERDPTIPPFQSRLLFEKLQKEGVSVDLIIVQNAGHNLLHRGNKGEITPSIEQIKKEIFHFFIKSLK